MSTYQTFSQIALNKIKAATYNALYSELTGIASAWYVFLNKKVDEPKHGKRYWNTKSNSWYTASAPGEYIARKAPRGSGGLMDLLRIFVGSRNPTSNFLRIYVVSPAYYTSYQEIRMNRKVIKASKEDFLEEAKKRLNSIKGKNIKMK